MRYIRRAVYSTIGIIFSALPVASALAQNATGQPARFCPSPSEFQTTDAPPAPVTPSVNAGMAAFGRRAYSQAYANLRPLADMGNVEAERDIGVVLRVSCGPNDKSAAVSWFQKAANAGDTVASAQLGSMYMQGDGVAGDDATAFRYLTPAAMAGNMAAQGNLGLLYLDGRGVAQNFYEGIVWSVRAGERGEPFALVHIAREYMIGRALPKNNDKALFFWFIGLQRMQAARKSQFQPGLENTARQMSQVQVKTIGETAQKWAPAEGALAAVIADANMRSGQ